MKGDVIDPHLMLVERGRGYRRQDNSPRKWAPRNGASPTGSCFWEMKAPSLKPMRGTGLAMGGSSFLAQSRGKGTWWQLGLPAPRQLFPGLASYLPAPQPGRLPGARSFRRVPTKAYDPPSQPPSLRTQTFKTRREGTGKALSGQIQVLCFEPGSRSARRLKPTARVVSLWLDVRNRYVYYAHY